MILKKRGLENLEFVRLIDFLDWESEDNLLDARRFANEEREGFRPVLISSGKELSRISPFCKLVGVKSEYNDNDSDSLNFEVVVEIPEKVFLSWIPNDRNAGPTAEKGKLYFVDAEPFLIMLNAIFGGIEEPKEALKRLKLFVDR